MYRKILIEKLSIVIPFYNESKRIKNTFKIIKNFIKKNKINVEFIFVNDGSIDGSTNLVKEFLSRIKNKKIKYKLISYKKNIGKGFAIIQGIKKSSSPWILTCDFDMSVLPSTYKDWLKQNYIVKKKCAYFASRNLKKSRVKTLWIRKFYGLFFKSLIKFLFNISLKDTQCGYKLYNSSYIKRIIPKLRSFGYVNDVEILIHLMNKNIEIKELPIKWTHRKESKISLLSDPIKMIFDLIKIKISF